MRRLGVYGANLPTKKERSVVPADFSIAGLIGFFDRKYDKPFRLHSDIEAKAIFGEQTNRNAFGWDCLNGFFANLHGEDGSIYTLSPVGNNAVQASLQVLDADSKNIFTVKASYMGEDEYGTFANRTGISVENGACATTPVSSIEVGTGSTVIEVESASSFRVGDIVHFEEVSDGEIVSTEVAVVTAISESDRTVTVSSALTEMTANEYQLSAWGFKIHTYRKSLTGIVEEVDKTLGETWCTLNSNDPDHYVSQVFRQSSYIAVEVNTNTTAVALKYPVLTGIQYLSGGTGGDSISGVSEWVDAYHKFDSCPVRMIANCETVRDDVQSALENYCNNRDDNPIAIISLQCGIISKQAMAVAGNFYQRSNEVDALVLGNWVGVTDPFSSSPIASNREVPAVGHIMGVWIYSIIHNGIHSSPARRNCPISNVNSVVGFTAENDLDRTELAENGVNVIQKMDGFLLRNAFTPSTAPEFKYANAVIQRNYIKISCVDSLQESENTPNTIAYVREDRMAVLQFMHKLWRTGSNGSTREGETFGQYEKEDGSLSTVEDAFEVIADATNNSVATLQAGERNVDIWFMFPAPAGSIKVGVGLIYKTIS